MIDHLRDRGLGVDPVCRVLELSPSTYFARKKRPKSARRLRDEQLMPLIEQVHEDSGGTYGARRITRALGRKGHEVARCTVERLMAELGLEGVIRGRRRRTTVPEPSAPPAAGPGRPRLHREPPGPAVGRRHDLCPHMVGLGIRGVRPGRVLPDDRRLAGREPHADRTSAGRTGDGPVEAEDQEGLRPRPSQRQGFAIRINSVYRPARRNRRLRLRRVRR
ncbi:hypothetical protein SCOCK_210023 [Actinacidiphila cocklensis]|uniref:HTH-like domain-containing protein n=1 Tax=Actinacidiphila cocklensis TaxID=887465 RepID=A0A9W4DNV4_9ACTN|nr:hypothetical protein SCOCK_210023 [Actinacidiphila cocklensis]